MAMTTEQITAALLAYANKLCGEEWTALTAPGPVNLFIEKAQAHLANAQGLSAKRLGDASWTYSESFPQAVVDLLKPYRKVRFV